ncbi:pitrilysin family protein [Pararhodobacter sp. SW119]|uniref:M16 family metallopeptidase n=1 Tax=Pararhodobacter sp. SW119 TaxID=2780075 RepID=UPI001AE02D65|nr:pitrilysin family protein [Pararhodobacter sp. SW119]
MIHFVRILAVTLLAATPLRAEIDIQPVETDASFSAWLVEERSIPFVAIEVVFPGGAVLDTEDRLGATSLMTELLSEGAGDLDSQAFAAAVEATAGSVRFDAGRDSVSLRIRALTENRDEVLELARMALTDPRFDETALHRVRAQTIASLERDARNPNTIASQTFNELAFAGHPYARPTEGTPETVSALSRDDILTAHRTALTRDRVLVGAAGDISAEDLGQLLDDLLGDLPEATVDLPDHAAFTAPGGITVVEHPGPQSVVAFGHAGIRRDDPDFMAAFVMNEIFGGGRFGTRLMRELRETRGLTYGIGTSVATAQHGDSFQGRLSTDNSRVGEVVALLRSEWEWLAEGGITQADLERVQTYLTGAYPLRFDGNASIAGILASMQFQGFDIDYVNVRNDLVRALTLEDIHRVAGRMIDPEALHFVIVGQPQGLDDLGF